jgi:hypothetical protein
MNVATADALVAAAATAAPGSVIMLAPGRYDLGQRQVSLRSVSLLGQGRPAETVITAEAPPDSFNHGQILRVSGTCYLENFTVRALSQEIGALMQPRLFQYPIWVGDDDADLFLKAVHIDGVSDCFMNFGRGRVRMRGVDLDWRSQWDVIVIGAAPGGDYLFANSRFTAQFKGVWNVAARVVLVSAGCEAAFLGCELNALNGPQGSYCAINRGVLSFASCRLNATHPRQGQGLDVQVFTTSTGETIAIGTKMDKLFTQPGGFLGAADAWNVQLQE